MKNEVIKQKRVCEYTNEKITEILVNKTPIVQLTAMSKRDQKYSGFDARSRFYVHNYTNDLNLKYFYPTARSIKQVIEYFERKLV